MAKRGEFVWYELMTTDPEAAKKFYSDVVGWGTAPFENGSGMDYTMWMKGEAPVGGVMELPEEARRRCAPALDRVRRGSGRRRDRGEGEKAGRTGNAQAGGHSRGRPIRGPLRSAGAVGLRVQGIAGHARHERAAPGRGRVLARARHLGPQGRVRLLCRPVRVGEATGDGHGRRLPVPDVRDQQEDARRDVRQAEKQPGPPAWLYYTVVGDLDGAVEKNKKKTAVRSSSSRWKCGESRVSGRDPTGRGGPAGLHELTTRLVGGWDVEMGRQKWVGRCGAGDPGRGVGWNLGDGWLRPGDDGGRGVAVRHPIPSLPPRARAVAADSGYGVRGLRIFYQVYGDLTLGPERPC